MEQDLLRDNVRSLRLPEAQSGFVAEEFKAWWNALDVEDRTEFTLTFNGSPKEASFVFLLDKWMISGGKWTRPDFGMIVEAYAVAYNVALTVARRDYHTALDHPAVKSILARLTYRETLSSFIRIQHKQHTLIEKVVDQALTQMTPKKLEDGTEVVIYDVKLLNVATKAAQGLASTVQMEAAAQRSERTKGAMKRARDAANSTNAHDLPSEEELVIGLREVREKLGDDRFQQLVAASQLSQLG